MDEESGMNFSEYVAVLSGNTDLLEKAKLDKKITALESERKNFMKERDAASGKLQELEHSVEFHTSRVAEAKKDLALFEACVQRDAEGNAINKLELTGLPENCDMKLVASRLQEIAEKARTQGEYHRIGSIYGFDIFVKTESSAKDLFQSSVNRFFVKGEGSIYYTHNNGKLASDPKLACQNFLSALERIPKVMATHEKELTRAAQDIEIYKAMASGQWNKEDELRSLKAQAAELDRKIALTLAPVEEAEVAGEEMKQKENVQQQPNGGDNTRPISTERLATPEESSSLTRPTASRPDEKEEAVSKGVFAKPKIR